MSEVSRRVVVKSAAWAIPVVSLSVAAPASASSGAPVINLAWRLFNGPFFQPVGPVVTEPYWFVATRMLLHNYGTATLSGPVTITFEVPPGLILDSIFGNFTTLTPDDAETIVLQYSRPIVPNNVQVTELIYFRFPGQSNPDPVTFVATVDSPDADASSASLTVAWIESED